MSFPTVNISVTTGPHGQVNNYDTHVFWQDGYAQFVFTPDLGYKVHETFVDANYIPCEREYETCKDIDPTCGNDILLNRCLTCRGCHYQGSYLFRKPLQTDHTLMVSFEPIIYNINVFKSAGGTVSPDVPQYNPNFFQQVTFAFTPNQNYHIERVLIDNKEDKLAKKNGYHTFFEPRDNHSLKVYFKINRHQITVRFGSCKTTCDKNCVETCTFDCLPGTKCFKGGNVYPSDNQIVEAGSNISFNFNPWTWYQILDVRVDGVSQPLSVLNKTHLFENVIQDHLFEVIFGEK